MSESPALDKLSVATFRPCQGQMFCLDAGDQTIELVLTSVSSLKGDTPREDKNPFSLLFHGPPDAYFEQQTVVLNNETLGELTLFLVPLGPDPDDEDRRMLYEAIFT